VDDQWWRGMKPVLVAIVLGVACDPALAEGGRPSPYERFIETTRPLDIVDGVARPTPAAEPPPPRTCSPHR
jgi:hypothetical protein